jgi:hypothetical protein
VFDFPFTAELPPSLAVLDVGTNEFTGSLPAIPETLRYLGASNNSLSGSIPALPPTSQLRFLYLQNNQLTGGLPASLIDGHAPLLLLDLHNNKLTGQLDGAVGDGSAGRRLLQQAAAAGGGRAWSFDTLALLDLSKNDFSGGWRITLVGWWSIGRLAKQVEAERRYRIVIHTLRCMWVLTVNTPRHVRLIHSCMHVFVLLHPGAEQWSGT